MAKLLISPLSTYERNGWYCPELVWFIFSAGQSQKHKISFAPVHNFIPAGGGRNVACKKFLETDNEWILMVDNDMVPPFNLLEMLDKATPDMDILIPLFHLWENDTSTVKVVWAPVANPDQMSVEELNATEWLELQSAGTGCIFIHRRVFEKLPYPWFGYEYDKDGCMSATEDVPFLQTARKHGFRVWGNTRYTVGHFRSVDLSKIQKYK